MSMGKTLRVVGRIGLVAFLVSQTIVLAPCVSAQDDLPKTRRKAPPHGIPADVQSEVEIAQKRVEKWFPVLGPKLGAHLTNPNVVLLLANERGLADLNLYDWTDEDKAKIEEFNKQAEKDGLRLYYDKSEDKVGAPEVMAWFESLDGFEKVSKTTKIAIPKYDAKTGWDGLTEWKKQAVEAVIKLGKDGEFKDEQDKSVNPQKDQYFPTADAERVSTAVLRGLAYAYPDTAVINKDLNAQQVCTKIPYGDFHRASEPNFYYAVNANIRDVNALCYRWSLILGEYFHSPQYLKLAQEPAFRRARHIADGFGERKESVSAAP